VRALFVLYALMILTGLAFGLAVGVMGL
jgi:hypothetical protein